MACFVEMSSSASAGRFPALDKASISLTQLDPCEHRVGNVCPHLKEMSVMHFKCYPMVCNKMCKELGGPNSYNPIEVVSGEFIARVMTRAYALLWLKIIPKKSETRIFSIPDLPEELWDALHRGAEQAGGTLLLGGSCIRDPTRQKSDKSRDIDAMVLFDGEITEERIQSYLSLKNGFPSFDGYQIDWWPEFSSMAKLLPCLDPSSKTLYGSPKFVPSNSVIDGLFPQIKPHPMDPYIDSLTALATEKALRKEEKIKAYFEYGLGDIVGGAIKLLSFGKIKECAPCSKRRKRLNKWGRDRNLVIKRKKVNGLERKDFINESN